jgi:type VI secretion system secreted protein Hcp
MKLVCVAASVLLLSAGVAAQGSQGKGNSKPKSGITLTIAGQQFACTTPAGSGAFNVAAWSWGASNPTTIGGGSGGGAGKVSLSSLNVIKEFDACSPALFGAVATGRHFESATLVQSNSDGTVTTLALTDVIVESWQASGSIASEQATESLSLVFAKVCLTDGGSGARFCYDVAANKTF